MKSLIQQAPNHEKLALFRQKSCKAFGEVCPTQIGFVSSTVGRSPWTAPGPLTRLSPGTGPVSAQRPIGFV
jgi:hypothetical protein